MAEQLYPTVVEEVVVGRESALVRHGSQSRGPRHVIVQPGHARVATALSRHAYAVHRQSMLKQPESLMIRSHGHPKLWPWHPLRNDATPPRLGGFLARKHDGDPGWQTLWRGWRILDQHLRDHSPEEPP